jgi:hypothetical protein
MGIAKRSTENRATSTLLKVSSERPYITCRMWRLKKVERMYIPAVMTLFIRVTHELRSLSYSMSYVISVSNLTHEITSFGGLNMNALSFSETLVPKLYVVITYYTLVWVLFCAVCRPV